MCTFITLFLPTDFPYERAAAILKQSGRTLSAQASESLQSVVGDGWRPWLTTGSCDCGTALASAKEVEAAIGQHDTERWRKKGWSEAKIARALAEQLARHEQDRQLRRNEGLGDAGQWLQRIDALLGAGAARIGLLVRDYDGAVSARQPKPPERHWSRDQLDAADLLAFAPGTLHWIERG
jgi:hypothetical protein